MLGVGPAERFEQHAVFQLGELVLWIHVAVDPGPGDPPADDHVAFTIDGPDGHAATLTLPWGRSACGRDPDGRLVEPA